MNRRSFLRSSAVLAAFSPMALRAQQPGATPATGGAVSAPASPAPSGKRRNLKKGFMWTNLGGETAKKLTVMERFQLLKEAGFHGAEMASAMKQDEVLKARDATGLEIPSVVIQTHWQMPISHPSENVRAQGLEGLKQGLRDAKAYGAKSVLFVPGTVNKDVSYADAYTRSIAEIKKAIPLAEELGVAIALENVWNAFLLSPLEAAAYVDQFKSPMVRWHFDVGNVVNSGWPQHWIATLGPRIAAVHVKEFSRKLRDEKGLWQGFRTELMTGDSDWPAVMKAFDAINYQGWMIIEQWRQPNLTDLEWLKHVSGKLDDILAV